MLTRGGRGQSGRLRTSPNNAPAKETGNDLTQIGITLGTPLYMSPEQVEGKSAGPALATSIRWASPAIHMLCGSPPFTRRNGPGRCPAAHQKAAGASVVGGSLRSDLPPALYPDRPPDAGQRAGPKRFAVRPRLASANCDRVQIGALWTTIEPEDLPELGSSEWAVDRPELDIARRYNAKTLQLDGVDEDRGDATADANRRFDGSGSLAGSDNGACLLVRRNRLVLFDRLGKSLLGETASKSAPPAIPQQKIPSWPSMVLRQPAWITTRSRLAKPSSSIFQRNAI